MGKRKQRAIWKSIRDLAIKLSLKAIEIRVNENFTDFVVIVGMYISSTSIQMNGDL
jgi:hypothetical protein